MAKHQNIPLELQREIEQAIKERYSELAEKARVYISDLAKDGTKISGKATFWVGANDSSLRFEYDPFPRNGAHPLYIAHDWND